MHQKRSTLLWYKIKSVPALHPPALEDDAPFAAIPLLEIEGKRAMAQAGPPWDQLVRVGDSVRLSPVGDYVTRKAIILGSTPESDNPSTELLRACPNPPLVNVPQGSPNRHPSSILSRQDNRGCPSAVSGSGPTYLVLGREDCQPESTPESCDLRHAEFGNTVPGVLSPRNLLEKTNSRFLTAEAVRNDITTD